MEKKDKKDFKLYKDSLQIIKKMTNAEAGQYIKLCLAYWEEENFECDRLVEISFEPLKAQFERDFNSYLAICERNKENWKEWWRPKTQNNPENPVGYLWTQNNPNEPDTDTDTDTDNHTDTDTETDNKKNIHSKDKNKEQQRKMVQRSVEKYINCFF